MYGHSAELQLLFFPPVQTHERMFSPQVCLVRPHLSSVGRTAHSPSSSLAQRRKEQFTTATHTQIWGFCFGKKHRRQRTRQTSQNLSSEHLCSSQPRSTQKNCSELGFRGTLYTVICIFKMLKLLGTNVS